jgi:uncharacterized membrane protein
MLAPIVVAIVTIAISIPLIMGLVPPNGFYGFRTPKTLSSPEIWYPANRVSGIYLALAGLVTLITTLALRGAGFSPERSAGTMLALILGPLTVALIASFLYLRKL